MAQQNTRREVEEVYASAVSSSDLKVQADTKGDVDVLIAAGWNPSRVGMALLRLQSEYDSAARQRPLRAADFASAEQGAKALADAANEQHARLLFAKLKSLPAVQRQLAVQLARWKVESPMEKAGAMARWWLQRRCSACNGTGFGMSTGKACKGCAVGEVRSPLGDVGKRMANHMDDCVHRARQSISKRLRFTAN